MDGDFLILLRCATLEIRNPVKKRNFEKNNFDKFYYLMLPVFVLLKVEDLDQSDIIDNWEGIASGDEIPIGHDLFICGTPFGDISPKIFINSISKGILCNKGQRGALMLTDARCIPGGEGGAVYSKQRFQNNRRYLVGIIVASMCWKVNEWIGLSLVCNLSAILGSIGGSCQWRPTVLTDDTDDNYLMKMLGDHSENRVVMVQCAPHWGSGLLLDDRTILTCSHVVAENKLIRVSIGDHVSRAQVVYSVPSGEPFDLAVLLLEGKFYHHKQGIVVAASTEGDDIYTIGHALFDENCTVRPTVTKGVISKIVSANGVPAIIQTDCTVNQGASGGVLMNRRGDLVGIISCNCRDTETKAVYPNVNLSVPMVTIWPVLKDYLKFRNPEILQRLHCLSPSVKQLWQLKPPPENRSKL